MRNRWGMIDGRPHHLHRIKRTPVGPAKHEVQEVQRHREVQALLGTLNDNRQGASAARGEEGGGESVRGAAVCSMPCCVSHPTTALAKWAMMTILGKASRTGVRAPSTPLPRGSE